MVLDSRGVLPVDWAGGGAGSPCARRRLRTRALPTAGGMLGESPIKSHGDVTHTELHVDLAQVEPGVIPEADKSFAGTANLPFKLARSRTAGLLKSPSGRERSKSDRSMQSLSTASALSSTWGSSNMPTKSQSTASLLTSTSASKCTSPLTKESFFGKGLGEFDKQSILGKAMRLRTLTNFEMLVELLVEAIAPQQIKERTWKQRPIPSRPVAPSKLNEDQRRRKVLQALRKHPLCDIYDLLRCSEQEWSMLGGELALSHSDAKRAVLDYVNTEMCSMDKAAFWTIVGPRQNIVDMGRSLAFAGGFIRDSRPDARNFGKPEAEFMHLPFCKT